MSKWRPTRGEVLVTLAVLCLTLGAVALSYAAEHAFVVRLEASAAGECYRVQVQRWATNRANYARWRVAVRFASLIRHPPKGSDRQSPAVRRQALAFAKLQSDEAATTIYTPWTDCRTALNHPTTYRPPLPIPFSIALRNPRYRWQLGHLPPTPRRGGY